MPKARIDGDRLWSSLMALAQIGATPRGGVRRITLTPADREMRAAHLAAAGCSVLLEAVGT